MYQYELVDPVVYLHFLIVHGIPFQNRFAGEEKQFGVLISFLFLKSTHHIKTNVKCP